MIYCYHKSQRDALFLRFFLVKNSTCFGLIYCPSSGVLIVYTQQLVFVVPVNITGMTTTYCCVCSIKTPNDGQ